MARSGCGHVRRKGRRIVYIYLGSVLNWHGRDGKRRQGFFLVVCILKPSVTVDSAYTKLP